MLPLIQFYAGGTRVEAFPYATPCPCRSICPVRVFRCGPRKIELLREKLEKWHSFAEKGLVVSAPSLSIAQQAAPEAVAVAQVEVEVKEPALAHGRVFYTAAIVHCGTTAWSPLLRSTVVWSHCGGHCVAILCSWGHCYCGARWSLWSHCGATVAILVQR